jgi:hypothetical protein
VIWAPALCVNISRLYFTFHILFFQRLKSRNIFHRPRIAIYSQDLERKREMFVAETDAPVPEASYAAKCLVGVKFKHPTSQDRT